MLCYKDKCFCSSDCVRRDCFRYFGEQEKEDARKWWSHDPDNAPVAMSDYSTNCEGYTNVDPC